MNYWKCKNCGKVGEFKLLSKGLIQCSNCNSKHFVAPDGNVYQV